MEKIENRLDALKAQLDRVAEMCGHGDFDGIELMKYKELRTHQILANIEMCEFLRSRVRGNPRWLEEGEVVVVDLDPLSHGGPNTVVRTKYEILKVSEFSFEVDSSDGENCVEIDSFAVAKILEEVELLYDDGSAAFPGEEDHSQGYLEIWYCVGGKWTTTEFGSQELNFLDEKEWNMSPRDAAGK